MTRTRWLLPLVLVLATRAPAAAQPEPRLPPPDATPMTGTWRGSYVCGQGETALTLRLRGYPDGRLEGTFEFGEHPDNPGVPSGSYRVHGRMSPGFVVTLQAGEWIVRPPDYVTVPLVGRLRSEPPAGMDGWVDDPNCGFFSVDFVQPAERAGG
jgi:hypothetical protein